MVNFMLFFCSTIYDVYLTCLRSRVDCNAGIYFSHYILRDYLTAFKFARSIKPIHHYQPESFSPRACNGQGLILMAITKTLSYNLFIK